MCIMYMYCVLCICVFKVEAGRDVSSCHLCQGNAHTHIHTCTHVGQSFTNSRIGYSLVADGWQLVFACAVSTCIMCRLPIKNTQTHAHTHSRRLQVAGEV